MRIGNIVGSGHAEFTTDSSYGIPAAPAISFEGDTNTGIYQPTSVADTIAFSTASTERLRIESDGTLTVDGGGVDTGYAALVTAENDVPNKKYVDDAIGTATGAQDLGDLADVTDTSTAAAWFVVSDGATSWVTEDAATTRTSLGLVAGGAGDIWVEKGGDSMDSAANLTFSGGGEVIGLPAVPSGPTAAASKAYVDAQAGGLEWIDAVFFVDLLSDTPSVDIVGAGTTATVDYQTPSNTNYDIEDSDMIVVDNASLTFTAVGKLGASSSVSSPAIGTVLRFEDDAANGNLNPTWQDLGALSNTTNFPLNSRWGVSTVTETPPGGTFAGNRGKIYELTANTGTGTWALVSDLDNAGTGAAQVETVQTPAASTFTSSGAADYFLLETVDNEYYVWFDVDNGNTDPDPVDTITGAAATDNGHKTGVEVDVASGDTAIQVAGKLATALAALSDITSASNGGTDTVTVTHATVGATNDAEDVNSGVTVAVSTQGNWEDGPQNSYTFLVDNTASQNAFRQFTYVANRGRWVLVGATQAISPGIGLSASGNVWNVDLGAGIQELPTDEVGLDIRANGALITTLNGSTSDTTTGAELWLLLEGTTLTQSSSGLKVDSGGITGTELNTSVAGSGLVGGGGSALDVNLTTNGGLAIATDAVQLDISDLVGGGTAAGTDAIAVDQGAAPNVKFTLDEILDDLDIVHGITGNGITVRTSADTYVNRSVVQSTAAGEQGGQVNNGDGVSGNIEIGVDITNLTASGDDLDMGDEFIIFDGTNNVKMTGQQIADGISNDLTLDFTRIRDSGNTTFVDTDATSNTITTGVAASASRAAGTPLTLSANEIDITSSDGTGGNAGAPIDVNAGSGDGAGGGGAITVNAGTAGATGAGGSISLDAGLGGVTSGAGGSVTLGGGQDQGASSNGGAVNVAGANGAGGAVSLTAGAGGTGYSGGAINVTAGAGDTQTGGAVTITAGAASGAFAAGGIELLAGNSPSNTAGSIDLKAGDGTTDGTVNIKNAGGTTQGTLRFFDADDSNWIGFATASAVTSNVTYTLPEAPVSSGQVLASTTGGALSWVDISGGVTGGAGIDNNSGTLDLDIGELTTATIATTDFLAFASGPDVANENTTVANFLADLDIVNSITGGNGIVVQTAGDTYVARTITASVDEDELGAAVTNGDGVSGNPTVGVDIVGLTDPGDDLAAADEFIIHDKSEGVGGANRKITAQNIADGLSTLLTLDNTRIRDSGDTTFVDTDATADTITTGVAANASRAAGTPLTMSADEIDLTASNGTGANAGGAIDINGGTGASGGAGGNVTIDGGTGGSADGIGGFIKLVGGDNGQYANVDGGYVSIYGGAASGGDVLIGGGDSGTAGRAGGHVQLEGGSATTSNGGNVNINGGYSSSGAGGYIEIDAGNGNSGGYLHLYAGTADTTTGGPVVIRGGAAAAGTDGGSVSIYAGNGNINGGDITIGAGSSGSANEGGVVTIQSGTSATGNPGDINITAASTTTAAATGGDVNISAGSDGTGTANGGSVNIAAGTGDTIGYVNVSNAGASQSGELRILDNTGGQYIGLTVGATVTSLTYQLPEAPAGTGYYLTSSVGGVMSWVAGSVIGGNSFSTWNSAGNGSGSATAASTSDSIDITGGDGINVVLADGSPDSATFSLTRAGLADTAVVGGDTVPFFDASATNQPEYRSFDDILDDLDIPHGIGSNGIVVRTAADTYVSRSIAVSGVGNEDGLTVTNADGQAGNPTLGLDIVGNATAGEDIAAGDLFLAYNLSGTANQVFTGQELADGVATLISNDNTRIHDSADTTFVDTDATAATITTGVAASGTGAAGTPLTLSAVEIDITGSAGAAATNPGAAIDINGGTGNTTGAGGAVTVDGGTGGSTGDGGAVTFTGGSGGASGGDGGDATICGGDAQDASGDGGDLVLCAGDGGASGAGGNIIIEPGTGGTDGTLSLAGPTSSTSTELRFLEASANGTNYIGIRAANSLSGNVSFIWPTADATTSGQAMVSDAAGNLSFATVASGLTAGDGIDITDPTISIDFSGGGLTTGSETLAGTDIIAVYDGTDTLGYTIDDLLDDLDVVHGITGNGLTVRTAADTYVARSIAASVVAGDEGISVVNGDGVSGNPTIGLDIVGLSDGGGNAASTDQLAVYDGTNNVEHTVAEIVGGVGVDALSDVDTSTTAPVNGDILVWNNSNSAWENHNIYFRQNFTSQTSVAVTHNIGQEFVLVKVYDNSASPVEIIPASVTLNSTNQVTVTFAVSTSGTIVVMGVPFA